MHLSCWRIVRRGLDSRTATPLVSLVYPLAHREKKSCVYFARCTCVATVQVRKWVCDIFRNPSVTCTSTPSLLWIRSTPTRPHDPNLRINCFHSAGKEFLRIVPVNLERHLMMVVMSIDSESPNSRNDYRL